ncbi:MAG: tRNA uridine-5-carboxymethylaminomethyl(34) synthesis GTPase MnmE [Gammaproteobacteria bacterium]
MHEGFYADIQETIVAVATASGKGGVGIVRLSGPLAAEICERVIGCLPKPRFAHYAAFQDIDKTPIDFGLTLYFKGPHSFTGEDVVEFQGHGGPIVLDQMVQRCIALGARLARPGEFSERAFLNGKIDLVQAEAIADLISASTVAAAKSALNSLKGTFSEQIKVLDKSVVDMRMYIEAAIDFPDEELEFIKHGQIQQKLEAVLKTLEALFKTAKQGVLLKDGMTVALIGEPNVGKSSLLNALCEEEVAIVSPIPGTTRDLVKEQINLDGIPLQVIDTAGIRDNVDAIEAEGIYRAQSRIASVDKILWITDNQSTTPPEQLRAILEQYPEKVLQIINKIDISGQLPGHRQGAIFISAKTRAGITNLKKALKDESDSQQAESIFIARRRHIVSISLGKEHIEEALKLLEQRFSGECIAEELRLAHLAFSEITGEFRADDLLGKIFSEFCIGK